MKQYFLLLFYLFIVYIAFSIFGQSFNAFTWSEGTRFWFTFVWIMSIICFFVAKYIDTDDNDWD